MLMWECFCSLGSETVCLTYFKPLAVVLSYQLGCMDFSRLLGYNVSLDFSVLNRLIRMEWL